MNQRIAHIALLVNDYDEAIEFYTTKLQFVLLEDTQLDAQKRWVLIAPKGVGTCSVLLAKTSTEEQKLHVGNQTGGRVFLFLHTDDFWRDYNYMVAHQIKFHSAPREETYGTVVVFEDLYGNKWDLIEQKKVLVKRLASLQ